MLTFFGRKQRCCDGATRREFLRAGALAVGGLSLADVLRSQAAGAAAGAGSGGKPETSVIMIFLQGGPSHIDTYDMKPAAPLEIRGEFRPIRTNVPGTHICELMPLQARMMDKLTVVRGIRFVDQHSPHLITTGFPDKIKRPPFGSVVSHLQGGRRGLPPYVSMLFGGVTEDPVFLGPAHRPFVTSGPGLDNMRLASGVSLDRLADRKQLLGQLDTLRREVDYGGALAGVDAFTARALDMVTSTAARDAFDVEKEPPAIRERYGPDNMEFLRARRLVEAGVSVVTLSTGSYDSHADNFNILRRQLPQIDRAIHALITDLEERGLTRQVAVVAWGEFGRSPRINPAAGREHWAPAGFGLLSGGPFKHGQVIGETDAHGGQSKGRLITPSNVLSMLYTHLGIDPATKIADTSGRPVYLLDDREPIRELV